MRKVLVTFALLLSSIALHSQQYSAMQSTLFSGTGSSKKIKLIGTGTQYHKVAWTKTGTLSGCTFKVDSSANGLSFNDGDVVGATTCTANGSTSIVSGSYNYIRVTVSSFAGTSNPSVTLVYNGYTNNPTGGGGATPAGGDKDVQLNDGGTSLGADAGVFQYNKSTHRLSTGSVSTSGIGPDSWSVIADPGSPSNGDDWYSSTTANRRKFRAGSTTQTYAWLSDIAGGASQFVVAPVNPDDAATAGDYSADSSYIYVAKATNSWVRTAIDGTWLPTVATPTHSPDTGIIASGAPITIASSTSGATLKYCTNAGSDCTAGSGSTYTVPITSVTVSGTHLCSQGTKTSFNNSATKCSTYTVSGTGLAVVQAKAACTYIGGGGSLNVVLDAGTTTSSKVIVFTYGFGSITSPTSLTFNSVSILGTHDANLVSTSVDNTHMDAYRVAPSVGATTAIMADNGSASCMAVVELAGTGASPLDQVGTINPEAYQPSWSNTLTPTGGGLNVIELCLATSVGTTSSFNNDASNYILKASAHDPDSNAGAGTFELGLFSRIITGTSGSAYTVSGTKATYGTQTSFCIDYKE